MNPVGILTLYYHNGNQESYKVLMYALAGPFLTFEEPDGQKLYIAHDTIESFSYNPIKETN